MNDIDIISLIKTDKLDEIDYFKTLINEAYNAGILDDNEMLNIQIQLVSLLDKTVYKYNGLESTSIRKEILEEISNSNIYTIGIYLKTFNNPDDAANLIKEKSVEYIYIQGRRKIEKMLNIIRIYYIKVKQNMLDIENITYNDTILGGIKGFLKIYNPDFNAQDMKITADYPIFNNLIGKLEGVEFIEEYIKSIYLENKFCQIFSKEKIKYLLKTYSEGYKDLIINIFEIVLLEVLACELIKKDTQDLIISESELNEIYNKFEDKNKQEIKKSLETAYYQIKQELLVDSKELQEYIEENFDYIVDLVTNLLEQKNLDKLFITEKFIVK